METKRYVKIRVKKKHFHSWGQYWKKDKSTKGFQRGERRAGIGRKNAKILLRGRT